MRIFVTIALKKDTIPMKQREKTKRLQKNEKNKGIIKKK